MPATASMLSAWIGYRDPLIVAGYRLIMPWADNPTTGSEVEVGDQHFGGGSAASWQTCNMLHYPNS